MTTSRTRRRAGGFSLVEVIVAIVIFGITMSALGALTLAVGDRSVHSWGKSQRVAVLASRMNEIASLSYNDLPGLAGCREVTGAFAYRECISVATNMTLNRRTVNVTITPAEKGVPPYSGSVEISKPVPINPFNVVK